MMGDEFAFIEQIRQRAARGRAPAPLTAIGDDCARWVPTPGWDQLVSTDLLLEGIHFDLSWTSLEALGAKAMAVNLSDLAAMGGCARRAASISAMCP